MPQPGTAPGQPRPAAAPVRHDGNSSGLLSNPRSRGQRSTKRRPAVQGRRMLAKDNRSVAGAGRGVALPCHAGAAAVAVRRAGISAAATARARKVGGAIRIVLAGDRDAMAGGAHLTVLASGAVRTSGYAGLAAQRAGARRTRSTDRDPAVGLAVVVRGTRCNREAKPAWGDSSRWDAGTVPIAVGVPATLVCAKGADARRALAARSATCATAPSRLPTTTACHDPATAARRASIARRGSQSVPATRTDHQETRKQCTSREHLAASITARRAEIVSSEAVARRRAGHSRRPPGWRADSRSHG